MKKVLEIWLTGSFQNCSLIRLTNSAKAAFMDGRTDDGQVVCFQNCSLLTNSAITAFVDGQTEDGRMADEGRPRDDSSSHTPSPYNRSGKSKNSKLKKKFRNMVYSYRSKNFYRRQRNIFALFWCEVGTTDLPPTPGKEVHAASVVH